MKNKILALILIGFLGIYMTPVLFANSQGNAHKAYPEFKPTSAKDTEVIKKTSLPGKGKPANPGNNGNKPDKDSDSGAATGTLGKPLSGVRYAIVIGIANYPGIDNDLKYTDEDAKAMKEVLIEQYEFLPDNIRFLVDTGDGPTTTIPTNATAQNIRDEVSAIEGLVTADDKVVFFFSGHGGKGKAKDGDKEKKDESIISHNGEKLVHIWDGDLKKWFSDFATTRIVFVFDSCAAGGMDDLADTDRIINMATKENGQDTAVEGIYGEEKVGAGEFTYHFVIKGMGEDLADTTEADGIVTIEEAFDYAKANVSDDHPTISDLFENDLSL